jgi:hypothetical protein
MGILWCACTAPLWAMPLWSWMHQAPTYSVECSVTEVFAGGAKTPRGSFNIVLREANKAGFPKGSTPLEGAWVGDPTLSVRIKAVDQGGGRFPLDVEVENRIELPDRGDGSVNLLGHGSGSPNETKDAFVMDVDKADGSGGRYEFEFHRKGGHWYQALLP